MWMNAQFYTLVVLLKTICACFADNSMCSVLLTLTTTHYRSDPTIPCYIRGNTNITCTPQSSQLQVGKFPTEMHYDYTPAIRPRTKRNRNKRLRVRKTHRGIRAGRKRIYPIRTVIDRFDRSASQCKQRYDFKNSSIKVVKRTSDYELKSCLNLSLWNARSIMNKIPSICDSILGNKIYIFIITESWIENEKKTYVDAQLRSGLHHYDAIHLPRPNRRGGGLSVISKNSLRSTLNTTEQYQSFEVLDLDICEPHSSDNFHVISIYRPPKSPVNNCNISKFFEEFSSFLEKTITSPGHLIIAGDFNIHVDKTNDNDVAQFLDLIASFGLTNIVQQPTHEKGHILDLLLMREDDICLSSVNIDHTLPSDHAVVHTTTQVRRPRTSKTVKQHRNLKSMSINVLKDLLQPSFSELEELSDVSTMAKRYQDIIQSTVDQLAPVQSKQMIDKPRPAWFTTDLIKQRQKVRSLERKWLRSKLAIDRELFTASRSDYKDLLEQTKPNFFRDKIDNACNDKALFAVIDELSGSKNITANIHPNVETMELCEMFSEYFDEKIVKIREKFDNLDSSIDAHDDETLSLLCEFNLFQSVSVDHVVKVVHQMNAKTCSLDPIPTGIVKNCLDIWGPVLTLIVNKSFETGKFPEVCKNAVVRPIIKKHDLDKNILKNYRPLSNCSFLDKFLEKCAFSQLNEYFAKNSLYGRFQSAYRQGHSTETALLKVKNDIMLALDSKSDVILVLLDLSAAFDTIDHAILLRRLKTRFCITGKALEWIKSFLCGRSQSVSVGGSMVSDTRPLRFGVPQGSVLGPVLFSLYVTPLEDIIVKNGCKTAIFADDTQVYLTCSNSTSISVIEKCVNQIRKWMCSNFLALNETKTEVIVFSSKYTRKCEPSVQTVKIGDAKINTKTVVRNLGVLFDENVTMSQHVKNVCKNASYALWRISKCKHLLDKDRIIKLIHAFVTCRIDYCNSLLLGCTDYQIEKLQHIQNSAARLVCGIKKTDRCHITPVLKSLHWLPVKARIIFKVICIVFQCIHSNTAPLYLKELIVVKSSNYMSLRSDDAVTLKRPSPPRTDTYGSHAFAVRAPSLWNDLPPELRVIEVYELFKVKLKTHLFRQYYEIL